MECQPELVNTFDLPTCNATLEKEVFGLLWDNVMLLERDNYCEQCLEPCEENIYNFEVVNHFF